MNIINRQKPLASIVVTQFLTVILLCDISQTCDLEQLSANGRSKLSSSDSRILLQSIEFDVQTANIVFRGITTNIYGSAVHVTRSSNNGWDQTGLDGDLESSRRRRYRRDIIYPDTVQRNITTIKSTTIAEKNNFTASFNIQRQPNANGSKKKRSKRTKNILYSDSSSEMSYQQPVDDDDKDDIQGVFTAYFDLINVYKGASTLAKWNSNSFSKNMGTPQHKQRVNVTFFEATTQCLPTTGVPREYIVFCELQGNDLQAISVVHWSDVNELRVWNALGWGTWSDWSACSVSCGNGIQQRSRFCTIENRENDNPSTVGLLQGGCPGPNIEQRLCNLFSCSVAINPLALEDRRFFHPSRSQWARVPERPNAWRLSPNAYIWVPVSQVFPLSTTDLTTAQENTNSMFPKEFTVFVTLRIQDNNTLGTLWSLRSRRQQDAYLSLELAGTLGVNLVHANGANGTDVVRIPANLGDGMWHYLALGIKDDSSVNTYVDCDWLRTDILKKDALNTPEDADLIIGYLFTGDLEQLVIVSNADAVNQQCSSTRIPITDPSLETRIPHKAPTIPTTAVNPVKSSLEKTPTQLEKYPADHTLPFKSNKTELEQIMEELEHEFTTNLHNIDNLVHWNIVAKKGQNLEATTMTTKNGKKKQRKGHHHKKNKKKISRESDRSSSCKKS